MVLFPDYIEKMFSEMEKAPPLTALMLFLLRDVHLDERIFGVKVYRTALVREFPYSLSSNACDAEQADRIKRSQYQVDHRYVVMGEHSPKWTPALIFERYVNLMEKYKQYGYDWIGNVPLRLGQIYRRDPSEVNLFALMGAYTSMISKDPLLVGEKDFKSTRDELTILKRILP